MDSMLRKMSFFPSTDQYLGVWSRIQHLIPESIETCSSFLWFLRPCHLIFFLRFLALSCYVKQIRASYLTMGQVSWGGVTLERFPNGPYWAILMHPGWSW